MYCPGLMTVSAVVFQENVTGGAVWRALPPCRGSMSRHASRGGPSGIAVQLNASRGRRNTLLAVIAISSAEKRGGAASGRGAREKITRLYTYIRAYAQCRSRRGERHNVFVRQDP